MPPVLSRARWLTCGFACLVACGGPTDATTRQAKGPFQVHTLSFPVTWLTERIAGDAADVTCIHPAGEDPPSWRPTPDQIAGLAGVDLILAHGAGYEAWVATATLPAARLFLTAAAQANIRS